MMRRLAATLLSAALLFAALAATAAKADPSEYGIASFSAAQSSTLAGAHPDLTVFFELNREGGNGKLPSTTREVVVELPPGLLGDPNAVLKCTTEQLMSTDFEDPSNATGCPRDSQVGVAEAQLFKEAGQLLVNEPLYNMRPPQDGNTVARLGFIGDVFPIVIDVSLRSEGDYGIEVRAIGTSSFIPLLSARTTAWGVPADKSHDTERMTPYEAVHTGGVPQPGGKRESNLSPAPFLTNPTRCGAPLPLKLTAVSYTEPTIPRSAETALSPITGCGKVQFEPKLSLTPTSRTAAEPTGLDSLTTMRQDETPNGRGTSTLRAARVVFPPQLSVAAGAGNGLAACSDAEVGIGTRSAAHCPEAAKIGVAEIDVPALERPLHAAVYQRTPLPGELLGLWLVADEQGLHLKLRGKIHTDPNTGQITAVFDEGTPQTEGLPQAPVASLSLDIFGGPRAPIAAPRRCGTYSARYEFTPWSGGPAVTGEAPMTFDGGCETGGFAPKLSGGSTEPLAGAFSTFLTTLSRESGEQEIDSFSLTLPKGLTAKLAGVALCEGAQATSGNCPAASQIGRIVAAAGPGPTPLWIPQPGKEPTAVYLAGPYKGAPYSAIAKVPAQVGPFDLGDVITRAALYIDPITAQARAVSDPLPRLLEGIPTSLRQANVIVDRKNFILNPTNCSPQQMSARVTSTEGAVATPSAPYGVGGCKGLAFKPSLSLRLKGKKTSRGGHPALRAVLRARPGDANIGRIQVALPHSEFIDQAHFQTICTRVQFAAKSCPAGSIYGHVTATSPILDYPVQGPIYLRSSNNELPDLVAVVRGPDAHPVEVNSVGRVDSVNGGIRATFQAFPDVPLSKAVVRMQGGKKGLFVNSRDICRFPGRAKVAFGGQNGKQLVLHPLLKADCG
jgi:hypothetical protein